MSSLREHIERREHVSDEMDFAGSRDLPATKPDYAALTEKVSATDTVTDWETAVQAERERQFAKGYDTSHDYSHGPDHLLLWAYDYARRGETVKVGALLQALRLVLELQREAVLDAANDVVEAVRQNRSEGGDRG